MRVPCLIEQVTLLNDNDIEVDSIQVTCSRCDHTTESFGTGTASVKRCLALLREECPNCENNYYYGEREE